MKKILTFICLILISSPVWAASQAESSGSATRGKYLAGKGIIIPENEVYVDSYIAQIDYRYPRSTDSLGVYMYNGHRQLSSAGQEEVIHIGIQARELAFEELPPMNLAFVIDKSGSMAGNDKLNWVKEAFHIFIERVRDQDFVALVVFNNKAELIFPSTRMDNMEKRLTFKAKVDDIISEGGTHLTAGLKLGYKEVFTNYRKEYTNRVLFLTDGQGDSEGILEMAQTYKELGINVSTIGVGTGFDLKLMTDLARTGGGSSRFISDRKEMEETFGSELDRMVVPAATNLKMKLELLMDMEVLGTWGYENTVKGRVIEYMLPTLHHRDYETILAHVKIPPVTLKGNNPLARFTIEYDTLNGPSRKSGPHFIGAVFVEDPAPVTGYSNGMVLRSGTMMDFALGLQTVASAYYSSEKLIENINELRNARWNEETGRADGEIVQYESLTGNEIESLEKQVSERLRFALDKTVEIRKKLMNVKLRLDNDGFDDEIEICNNYLKILGGELEIEESGMNEIRQNTEIAPLAPGRKLNRHIAHFLDEMILDMENKEGVTLVVSGFTTKDGESNALTGLLDEQSVIELKKLDNVTLVERDKMAQVLDEQKLALSDLTDTSTAIQIGRFLSAKYILTGSVIEMSQSVVVFGRIINVETAEVESVAQVILNRTGEVDSLLEK